MAKRLFGTDGIRGTAGEFPLDPKTTHAFGLALGKVARNLGPKREIVIGMDTRESSPWIAQQVAGGLKEAGTGGGATSNFSSEEGAGRSGSARGAHEAATIARRTSHATRLGIKLNSQ